MAEQPYTTSTWEAKASPALPGYFAEVFCVTFGFMVRNPVFYRIFQAFCVAYEYRRKIPWLVESQDGCDEIGLDGFAHALRNALSTYIISDEDELPIQAVEENEGKYLAVERQIRLLAAADALIDEASGLKRFEKYLVRIVGDSLPITTDVLCLHITAALLSYCQRQRIGIAPDTL